MFAIQTPFKTPPSLQFLISTVKAILLHCGPGKSRDELSIAGNQMALVKDREASHCLAWDGGGDPLLGVH